MSLRIIVTLVVIVLIIAAGLAMTLEHALKIGASAADPDSAPHRPAHAAPR